MSYIRRNAGEFWSWEEIGTGYWKTGGLTTVCNKYEAFTLVFRPRSLWAVSLRTWMKKLSLCNKWKVSWTAHSWAYKVKVSGHDLCVCVSWLKIHTPHYIPTQSESHQFLCVCVDSTLFQESLSELLCSWHMTPQTQTQLPKPPPTNFSC